MLMNINDSLATAIFFTVHISVTSTGNLYRYEEQYFTIKMAESECPPGLSWEIIISLIYSPQT